MTERDKEREVVCSNCGAEAGRTIGAYRFTESGLSNVTLIGVELIECPKCGNVDPIIPDVNDLMRAIAWHVATQRFRLAGEDVRFLRKYLKMNGAVFADLLGVDKSTLSKWENNADPIGTANERLVRSVALALGDGLKERSEEGIRAFTWITEEYHHGPVNVDMGTLEVQTK
jgi:putative zinc finger/helix-turn-helix YgiT family protein